MSALHNAIGAFATPTAASVSSRSRSSLASSKPRIGRRLGRSPIATSAKLQDGQLVTIHYVMTIGDGSVGDDTRKRNAPATIPLGQGNLFPVLEEGIKEMKEGEKRKFDIAAADAFGEAADPNKIQKLHASPEELETLKAQVQVGQTVQLPGGAMAVCVAIEEDGIVLDNNHPLAGQDLTFEIELVKVSAGPELFGVPIVPFDVNKLVMKK